MVDLFGLVIPLWGLPSTFLMKIQLLPLFLITLLCPTFAPLGTKPLHAVPPSRQIFPKIKTPGADVRPVAYAKTVPFPRLINQIQTLANEVQPENNQAQLLPFLIGSFLGDPTLSSISPDHSCNIIWFDDFQEKNATVLGVFKLNSPSPILEQIKIRGLSVRQIKDWTMITNNSVLFNQVKNWTSIVRFAERQPASSLELGLLGETFHAELIEQMKKNASTLSSDEDYAAKLFLEELVNLDSIKLSISLLKKNILIRLATSAREGTELDKLFSSSPPSYSKNRNSEVAEFVQGDGWFDAVANFNVPSHVRYFEYFLGKLEKGLKEKKFKEMVSSYTSMLRNGSKLYSGHSASSYRDFGDGNPLGFVQVGSTDASISDFKEILAGSNAFWDQLFGIDFYQNQVFQNDSVFKPEFVIKESAPVDGVRVLSLKIKLDSAKRDDFKIPAFANQTIYYSVYEGKYVFATNRKVFEEVLRAVKSGSPLENNLSQKIVLGPQHSVAWRLDLFGYAKLIGSIVNGMDQGPIAGLWAKSMKTAKNFKIPRISGRIGHGNGQYFFQLSIPVKTIRAISDFFAPAYIQRANEIRENSNAQEEAKNSPIEAPAKEKK